MYDIVVGRNEEDKKKFGTEGTILLGKHYVKMGQTTSLSNPILMDVTTSHVVFICGKRGSGKCLTGDTLVTLENGLEVPIAELEKNEEKVLSLDEKYKIRPEIKEGFYKREVNEVIKVTLRSGKKIKLTPEHPLLTIDGWKETRSLGIGSRIATPRRIECKASEQMSSNDIKLLAYLIAEGHTKRATLFSNNDQKIMNEFKDCVKKLHPKLATILTKKGCVKISSKNTAKKVPGYSNTIDSLGRFTKGSKIQHDKTPIRKFTEKYELFRKSALQKEIPDEIMQCPKNQLSLFLNRLFSCDGSIYCVNNYWEISYSSSSPKLAQQIQSLLLRFEIIARLRKKKVKYKDGFRLNFELVLGSENVVKYIKKIGFFGEKSEKALNIFEGLKTVKRNPNTDTIPKQIWDSYRPRNWAQVGKALNYKSPKALRSSIDYAPSRQKLLQIAVADKNDRLQLLAQSDIFWDEIVALEKQEGKIEVYDISVPSKHNFIANNIIVHNSYTMGVIAEGMSDLPKEVKDNVAVVMLDTMGIYWTMKYPNKKDEKLLEEWGLEPKGLNVQIYTPKGFFQAFKDQGIATDFPFSVNPAELDASNWCMSFDIDINSEIGVVIERVVSDLQDSKKEFDIDTIVKVVEDDKEIEDSIKDAVVNRFESAKKWGLFDKDATPIQEIVKAGQVTVLDVSCYATAPGAESIRALVIGLVSDKLFLDRMVARKKEEHDMIRADTSILDADTGKKKKEPLVWLVIDECLPYSAKICTDNGIKDIGTIVNEFSKGNKINVIGYDSRTKKYDFFPVTKCYKRPKREIMAFITETGQNITCTPDHKIYSSSGFCGAQKAKDIAFPLLKPYKKDKKEIEARLLGAIFGDGWLAKSGKLVGFSGKGYDKDLHKIKEDLAELGFSSSSINTKNTKSRIESIRGRIVEVNGISSCITASTKVWNHFEKLGAPIGTKVLIKSKIPSWIFKGTKEVKCEFLAGLMGADGYRMKRDVNIPSDFNPIRVSFNKIDTLEKNSLNFANQIKKLFGDIGVKVSNICKRNGNIRKDGNKTHKIQITLAKSVDNTIKFLENVGYRYCEKKEIEGGKWLAYLRYRKNITKEREDLRRKALKLHMEGGLGKTRIGKLLGLPDYVIREWIYYGGKAGVPKNIPSFKQWTKKREDGNNLFLRIVKRAYKGKEEVYDLSVGKVHNFVADDFLVHNCHEFLPNEGKTVATKPLITILREGRQPGISLILASQQPGKIHTDVMTQSDIVISHRITANYDVKALGMLMQSYMREGLDKQLNYLPRVKGSAIVFDDNNEKMYPMRVRPRFTWHGGSSPSAMVKKKDMFSF